MCAYDLDDPDKCAPPDVTIQCNETGSIYIDSLYTSLATIPGTILGIITVNILGGKLMLGEQICVLEYELPFGSCSNFVIQSYVELSWLVVVKSEYIVLLHLCTATWLILFCGFLLTVARQ